MRKLCLILIIILPFNVFSQEDYSWWNELHGWESGMPSWRTFLTISPGYLGPNALPVPEMKKGVVNNEKQIELGSDFYFLKGDNTQNIYGRFYYPFANAKIAIELYGVMLEHYNMSDYIRDERVARDKDGQGLAIGDFYFATLIQLFKDRKIPDTMVRLACKTASGGRFDAARYADAPGYFIDFSFSENLYETESITIKPYGLLGFYSWQTNDDMNLQNDALMYGAGIDFVHHQWLIANSWSGYHGYKNNGDRPMVYTFDVERKFGSRTFRIQYLHGLHDWKYKTIKFSVIWNWK